MRMGYSARPYVRGQHEDQIAKMYTAEYEKMQKGHHWETKRWVLDKLKSGPSVVIANGSEVVAYGTINQMGSLPNHPMDHRTAYERRQRDLAYARGDNLELPRAELEKWLSGVAGQCGVEYVPPQYFVNPFLAVTQNLSPHDIEFGEAMVKPGHRGRGLYREVFGARLEIARVLDGAEVIVTTSLMNQEKGGRIQEKNGFSPILEMHHPNADWHIVRHSGLRIND